MFHKEPFVSPIRKLLILTSLFACSLDLSETVIAFTVSVTLESGAKLPPAVAPPDPALTADGYQSGGLTADEYQSAGLEQQPGTTIFKGKSERESEREEERER